jgi:spermidine synthase
VPARDELISRATFAGVVVCFLISGAAGLVYQVAWSKSLGLIFGHTVYAVATVVAAFMAGLALGAEVLGRRGERHPQPLVLYAWIEFAIAATGALSLLGLAGVRALYQFAYPEVAGSLTALIALRFVASTMVLLIPTFLMGGTFPILIAAVTREDWELGSRLSRLYGVNTAGAVAGTLLAGFFLIPTFGLKRTVVTAVALNLLAGGLAMFLARKTQPRPSAVAAPTPEAPSRGSWLLIITFAVVGATAMSYEIAWTRLLSTTLGSSTFAFTLMLATVLLGIALGSLLMQKWLARRKAAHIETYATTQALTGLAALAFLIVYQELPELLPPILRATHSSFAGLILAQFLVSVIAMLPAPLVFGFNFPLVTLLIAQSRDSQTGRAAAVGRAYAANTLGAILGATLAGFWIIPRVGSFRLVALTGVVNLLLAVLLAFFRARHRVIAVLVYGSLLGVMIWVAGSGAFYNRALANFAPLLYWERFSPRLSVAEMANTTDLLFAEDGLNASVTVVRSELTLSLLTNGKVDASNRSTLTFLLLGHLGAVFHPQPRRVLVIGFGSGLTVSALARYQEVERIDCVEIEPAVLHAASYLGSMNRGVLRDPRVRIYIDDARNFLLTTREQYDLIISQPSDPWIAGVASLFTDEYYRQARARLRPGGMFVQWVQAYSIYPEDLRMVLATFVPNFPRVTLWRGQPADFFLLGETDPQPLTLDRLRGLWSVAALREDYERIGLRRPEGIVAFHRLDDVDLRRYIQGSPRNTDDLTRLEYRAPRALLAKEIAKTNREILWQQRSALLPRDIRVDDPNATLFASAETLINNTRAGEVGETVLPNVGEFYEVDYFLQPLGNEPPSLPLELLRGHWELIRGNLVKAKETFDSARSLDGSSVAALVGEGEVARRQRDFATAERYFHEALARQPDSISALEGMVLVARGQKRWQEAAAWQKRRIDADSQDQAIQYAQLGALLLLSGDLPGAERALTKALEQEPCSFAAHRNLGALYLRRREWEKAEHHLELAARYLPAGDPNVYSMLAGTYRALGKRRAAEAALRKGHRLFPKTGPGPAP